MSERVSAAAARLGAARAIWGLLLLAAGIAVLVATTTIRSPEGYAASGPRFVPLIVGACC